MNITIQHRITFSYSLPASYAIQHLRLSPRNSGSQDVLRWQVSVGERDRLHEFVDAHGNTVMEATQLRPHETLTVTATGEVVTRDTQGILSGLQDPLPLLFHCRPSDLTESDDAIRELAEAHRVAIEHDGSDGLQRLMHGVGAAIDLLADEPASGATAAEALAAGAGGAADCAHIFIAAARYIDVPARYVSGYLLHEPDTAARQATHGWAEAWLPERGWTGFDVSRQCCPSDAYVRLASGSDAPSAGPVRGSRRGGGTEAVEIELRVSQSRNQQQS